MTRKDFQLIARTISEELPPGSEAQRLSALAFADVLQHTNPNFDRARFLVACGVES
jgi:hypothetical protein